MALVFNEEQRLLKETAKKFVEDNSPVEALRKLRDSKDSTGYDTNVWNQMVEQGWAAIAIPEAYDGLEFGFMGLGAVIEETGRTLAASPLISTVVLGASAIMLGGNEEQKQTILPNIAAGALTLALAVDEGNHHNPARINMQAEKTANGYKLNGEKRFVLDGHSADKLIVAARTAGKIGETDGISLFLIDADTAGVTRNRTIMADSRNAADISFDNVEVAADALIGEADKGWAVLDKTLDRGRICLAAEMFGAAEECFYRTVEYLKEREQFDVKIGTFQALQHRAAELYVQLELCKSVILDALTAIDDDNMGLSQMASLAKAKLSDVFTDVANEAVQMHGGIGVTDEFEIGFFLKRARVASQTFGNAGFHRDRYATLCGY